MCLTTASEIVAQQPYPLSLGWYRYSCYLSDKCLELYFTIPFTVKTTDGGQISGSSSSHHRDICICLMRVLLCCSSLFSHILFVELFLCSKATLSGDLLSLVSGFWQPMIRWPSLRSCKQSFVYISHTCPCFRHSQICVCIYIFCCSKPTTQDKLFLTSLSRLAWHCSLVPSPRQSS